MAESYAVLGQSAPAATTDTALYTVPAASQAIVSTISVCNRDNAAAATFRIAVRVAGAALASQQYLYYDANLGPNATVAITIGVTLGTGDVLSVRASTANLSFQAFGTVVS